MIGVPICDKATRENISVAITRLPKFDRSLKHRESSLFILLHGK